MPDIFDFKLSRAIYSHETNTARSQCTLRDGERNLGAEEDMQNKVQIWLPYVQVSSISVLS